LDLLALVGTACFRVTFVAWAPIHLGFSSVYILNRNVQSFQTPKGAWILSDQARYQYSINYNSSRMCSSRLFCSTSTGISSLTSDDASLSPSFSLPACAKAAVSAAARAECNKPSSTRRLEKAAISLSYSVQPGVFRARTSFGSF
jgi:hypothetical protein